MNLIGNLGKFAGRGSITYLQILSSYIEAMHENCHFVGKPGNVRSHSSSVAGKQNRATGVLHSAASRSHNPRSTNPAANLTLRPAAQPYLPTGNECETEEQLHSVFLRGRQNPKVVGFQENELFSPVLRKERNGG